MTKEVSQGFDAGAHANVYETENINAALARVAFRSLSYRDAFVLGFFACYAYRAIPASARDRYLDAYYSHAGRVVLKAGYMDRHSELEYNTGKGNDMTLTTTADRSITIYRVQGSIDADGHTLDASQAEILGDEYLRWHLDEADAESAADDLRADRDGMPALAGVEYSVEPERVCIDRIALISDEEQGAAPAEVGAMVNGSHVSVFGSRSDTNALRPCGGSIDAWLDDRLRREYGDEIAIAIGRAMLAGVDE